MKQNITTIDRKPAQPRKTKAVAANEKAIQSLPWKSGAWKVQGVPGLYVRCRATVRSFYVARRIHGQLARTILGEMSLKQARAEAMREWGRLKPAPAGGPKTFDQAFEEFLEQKEQAETTKDIYRYNLDRYLPAWRGRTLEDIGQDRVGVRALYHHLKHQHGEATASQTIRMFSAVYRYARKVDPDLPESPTVTVSLPATKSRDWALSPQALQQWWRSVERGEDGKEIVRGVSTLGPIKRMWWLTCLLTGARRGSIEALAWFNVDLENKIVRFMVTKGNRPYTVPLSDKLADLLVNYRASGDVPPSQWVFPSPVKADHHIIQVRDDKRGVASAHHLRHTFRTILAELGASADQARLLMGHSMGGDVSRGYITASQLVESLRPLTNGVAMRLIAILGNME